MIIQLKTNHTHGSLFFSPNINLPFPRASRTATSSEQHRDTTIWKVYYCGNKPRSVFCLELVSVCDGGAGPRARLVAGSASRAAQARVSRRFLVVVVLPGARELAGSAAHSGFAAVGRP